MAERKSTRQKSTSKTTVSKRESYKKLRQYIGVGAGIYAGSKAVKMVNKQLALSGLGDALSGVPLKEYLPELIVGGGALVASQAIPAVKNSVDAQNVCVGVATIAGIKTFEKVSKKTILSGVEEEYEPINGASLAAYQQLPQATSSAIKELDEEIENLEEVPVQTAGIGTTAKEFGADTTVIEEEYEPVEGFAGGSDDEEFDEIN